MDTTWSGHNINLEDGSSHRRHIDQVQFRIDVRQEEYENPKPEQLERSELKTPLPTFKVQAYLSWNSSELDVIVHIKLPDDFG